MELKQAIAKRRSIRRFYQTDVPEGDVMQLLESVRLCQSACNRQPWRFLVARDERKQRVADTMLKWVEDHPDVQTRSAHSARVIRQAPVLIMVLRERAEHWTRSDEQSIGAAVEHICLTATDMGLGALWIGDTAWAETEILQAVGYPEMALCCVVAVGYAAEEPEARPRLTMEELVLQEK